MTSQSNININVYLVQITLKATFQDIIFGRVAGKCGKHNYQLICIVLTMKTTVGNLFQEYVHFRNIYKSVIPNIMAKITF